MEVYTLSSTTELLGYDDLKRLYFAERPREVDGLANSSAFYHSRRLLRQVFGRFDFTLKENWPKDYFLFNLFVGGEICILDTELGVIPLRCGHAGLNVYEEPTRCVIANPILGNLEPKIGEDCVLLRINYDYSGIMPIVERYAGLLAMCDSSLAVSLMNSKVAFIGLASSKNQANTMKKMYDQISMGQPAVFVNGDAVNQEKFFFNNVKQNFVGEEIMRVKRMITNDFLTEIGLNNANLDKRERLNSEEVQANDEEIRNNVQHWLDNINEGFREANEMFNLNLSVRVRRYDSELSESD
jgi:hypothetical protein